MQAEQLFNLAPTGRIRRGDYGTSIDATIKVGQSRMKLRGLIMEQLRKEPLTDRELCLRILPDEPLRWQSIISARSGLKADSLVQATGERRDGRQVWRVFGMVQDIHVAGDVL